LDRIEQAIVEKLRTEGQPLKPSTNVEQDVDVVLPLPTRYTLAQNYPNPFNPATSIRYDLPDMAHVRLMIYNLSGQAVRMLVHTAQHPPGRHTIVWDGRDDAGQEAASGIYLYRLEAVDGGFVETKRMVLLR
jgi:hypothetical protein